MSYRQSQKTIVFSTGGGGETTCTQKSVAVAKFSVWCFNLLFQGWEANSCRTGEKHIYLFLGLWANKWRREGGGGRGGDSEHVP